MYIAIVEDDPDQAFITTMMMRRSDRRGDAAFATFPDIASLRAADSRPDAIVLDLSLQETVGMATLEACQAAAPGVPIVVVSSWPEPELQAKIVAAGARAFIPKADLDGDRLWAVLGSSGAARTGP